MNLDELAIRLHAQDEADTTVFQKRARVLQALWREERNLPAARIDRDGGRTVLGSRLAMPWAETTLVNLLTPTIREVARTKVLEPAKSHPTSLDVSGICDDLLSSQALCLNVFGELQADLAMASGLVSHLSGGRFVEVTGVAFANPGELEGGRDAATAYDVFFACRTPRGGRGFVGVEVKYHQSLVLSDGARASDASGDTIFAVLYPRENLACGQAVNVHLATSSSRHAFAAWHLEDVVAWLLTHAGAEWPRQVFDRYLDFAKIERALAPQ